MYGPCKSGYNERLYQSRIYVAIHEGTSQGSIACDVVLLEMAGAAGQV